jgi:hypothetical protein
MDNNVYSVDNKPVQAAVGYGLIRLISSEAAAVPNHIHKRHGNTAIDVKN